MPEQQDSIGLMEQRSPAGRPASTPDKHDNPPTRRIEIPTRPTEADRTPRRIRRPSPKKRLLNRPADVPAGLTTESSKWPACPRAEIREVLAHCQPLLQKLTGKSTGELTVALKRLLGNKQGETCNSELAPAIAEAMTAFSVETERKFWSP